MVVGANVDYAVYYDGARVDFESRGETPKLFACNGIQCVNIVIFGSNVDDIFNNCWGCFHRVSSLETPKHAPSCRVQSVNIAVM
jgi:hypothetical protein